MKITKEKFDEYKGKDIFEYTLENGKNLKVKILNFGGIIRKIEYCGRNRVLGFDNIKDYIEGGAYFGAIIGRVAGRISNGRITIDNKVYELDKNEGSTCLHGGFNGFSFQYWEAIEKVETENYVSIKFKFISRDMECGFPGNLITYVVYSLDKNDRLIIEYFAKTDKTTIVTFTNHSYFNLNNSLSKSILNHKLKIAADNYIRIDPDSIPIEIASTINTIFDFKEKKRIGEIMDLSHPEIRSYDGYNHPFILKDTEKSQIELYSEDSKVKLNIDTTEPTVILYCGNMINKDMFTSEGIPTFKYQGVCLETQWYPDALNHEFLEDNILEKDSEYYSKTIYKFEKL